MTRSGLKRTNGRTSTKLAAPSPSAAPAREQAGRPAWDHGGVVRALLDASPDTALLMDTEGIILALNTTAHRRLGTLAHKTLGGKPTELVGQCVYDLFPGDLAKRRRALNDEVVRSGEPARYEDRRDGKWFDSSICAVRDELGKVIALAVFTRDITERKQIEETLRSQADELRHLNGQLTQATAHLSESQVLLVDLNEQLHDERHLVQRLNRELEEKVRERTFKLRDTNKKLRERNRELVDVRVQATTDGLTGLGNHRSFHERVAAEVAQSRESGKTAGLVMLDIDGFKRVNDDLGHLAGDEVLRQLACTLTGVVPSENAYRYGGDEFAILLPKADRAAALGTAEKLRRAIETPTFAAGRRITVSLGVAALTSITGPAEEWIYRADIAMYWAKSAGKNRVGDWEALLGTNTVPGAPWYLTDRAVRAPDVVTALLSALAAKDPVTSAHTERCSWYTARLADELGLEEEEQSVVRLASLLHDIGKLAVPDDVLFKPTSLNKREWTHMRKHPSTALHMLGHIRSLVDVTPAILHHHERFDGAGYPDGLRGRDIPIASRILLVTDAFDAMTTDRPYRKAMPLDAAIEELEQNSGTQFDPEVVQAFLRVLADSSGPEPLCSHRFAAASSTAKSAGRVNMEAR
jgi:diguanylate cyclase (GGDEF)-like protein/PAS domain S-box-containing protein